MPDPVPPPGQAAERPVEPSSDRIRGRWHREQPPGPAQPLLGAGTATAPERSRLPREPRPLRSFPRPGEPIRLHLINNGLTKGVLFLSAGNIHRAYGSKPTDNVRGIAPAPATFRRAFPARFSGHRRLASLWTVCQRTDHRDAAIESGQFLAGGLFLLFLGVVFVGMGAMVLAVVMGKPPEHIAPTTFRDNVSTCGRILLFVMLVVLLGVFIPAPLEALLSDAAAQLQISQVVVENDSNGQPLDQASRERARHLAIQPRTAEAGQADSGGNALRNVVARGSDDGTLARIGRTPNA